MKIPSMWTRRFAPLALTVALTSGAQAALVVATLPDFDGPEHGFGFPIDLGIVGTFSYYLPGGAVISAAVFSGVYGTSYPVYTTASYNVEIEGETIVVCPPLDPGCMEYDGPVFRPFSFALGTSTFAGLLDGLADLRVIQTTDFIVRLGSPTLTIEYQVVPEPAGIALAGLALLLGGAATRRRRGGGASAR